MGKLQSVKESWEQWDHPVECGMAVAHLAVSVGVKGLEDPRYEGVAAQLHHGLHLRSAGGGTVAIPSTQSLATIGTPCQQHAACMP